MQVEHIKFIFRVESLTAYFTLKSYHKLIHEFDKTKINHKCKCWLILQADQVRVTESGRCIYTRSPAFTMGVIATLTVMMAQIILNVAAGCLCCGAHAHYQSPLSTAIAMKSLVLSW